jgi:hypothetical protein
MTTLNALKEVMNTHISSTPISNLLIDETYMYKANGSPFDKSFFFTVKEDRYDSYLISIMGETDFELQKDFELVEAVNNGIIVPHKVKK